MTYPDVSETLVHGEADACSMSRSGAGADAVGSRSGAGADAGLTRDERAAPFAIAPPPPDDPPLPRRTRNPIVFEGERWVEIDMETGEIVAEGACAP